MALDLLIGRDSINATATEAYIEDLTPYGEAGGWDDGANPSRGVEGAPTNDPAALLIFLTKLGSTIDEDEFIDLLASYDPETAPNSLDPNNKVFVTVDIETIGDGIYFYQAVVLRYLADAGGADGYFWDAANNKLVFWDDSELTSTDIDWTAETPASTAENPEYYKDLVTSAANNDGYVADVGFYDIIFDVQATRTRSQLAVDITKTQCDCGHDKAVQCSCCLNKTKIHDMLDLQLEGAVANWSYQSYRQAARNFDMIEKLINEANALG